MNHPTELTLKQPLANMPTTNTKKRKTMPINEYFSLPRFGHLMRKELAASRRLPLIVAAATFFLLSIIAYAFMDDKDPQFHQIFYPILLLGGGFIFTSISFSELYVVQQRQSYLNLPASTLEKFLSKYLISGIGFITLTALAYWIFSIIIDGISRYFFDYSFHTFKPFGEHNQLFFKIYLGVQTIFFLGAILFRKYNFFKTVASAFVVIIILEIIAVILFRIVFYDMFDGLYRFRPEMAINGHTMQVEPSDSFKDFAEFTLLPYLKFLGLFAIPAFLLVIGYFKLKEKEL